MYTRSQIQRKVFKEEFSLLNRLQSIHHDSRFVDLIKQTYGQTYSISSEDEDTDKQQQQQQQSFRLPIVANLRCGAWYYHSFDATCYFKSTDGHYGNWSFSTNRLNLHLLDIISKHNGCIIIDSTRKGKKYPDSFSRTVPIWACTINRVIHKLKQQRKSSGNSGGGDQEDGVTWDENLNMPAWVSESEKDQIEKLVLDKFSQSLLSCGADLDIYLDKLCKPVRPIWINTETIIWSGDHIPNPKQLSFYPIYLVSCSDHRREGDSRYRSYVQGAGDDDEKWAMGLTPSLFWANKDQILCQSADYIDDYIQDLILESKVNSIQISDNSSDSNNNSNNRNNSNNNELECDKDTIKLGDTNIYISSSVPLLSCVWKYFDVLLNCSNITYDGVYKEEEEDGHGDDDEKLSPYLHLPISEGKFGKDDLEFQLQDAEDFIYKHLKVNPNARVLIHSTHSKPNCVCIALVLITKYYLQNSTTTNTTSNSSSSSSTSSSSLQFQFNNEPKQNISKDDIKKSYLFIEKYCPQSLPCKVMRLNVNRHMMSIYGPRLEQKKKWLESKNINK
ncbi:hypothetical protein CYY_004297 [Polysphondylium violaceum]|uniref:Initiator tRNA phosphoribosyl transferase n=1 Tax=Polysphondylium violaceum TaxID=133409 RepID=A0A8J4UT42_9MYCE|nr:hypothetical protein CYY_004297 [Polysphondylium violaceum]